ncbi:Elongation factor 1-beta, variant 3 [Balamuthia mandrillaris]
MASFDVSTPAGLGKFNGHLADKSYINGFLPSQDDVKIFNEVSKALPQGPEEKFVHAYRWFKHIKSFSEEEKAAFGAGGASSSATAAEAPAAEDDDFDVFGETSAEEEEAERKRREAEAAAKKKPAIVQKSNIILDVKPWDDETGTFLLLSL